MGQDGVPGPLMQRAIETPDSREILKGDPSPLKPGQAVLLSAVLPGASQIHQRRLRGYLMLGVEAGTWFAYQAYHSGGNDRQVSAEKLAGSAYSVDTYRKNALAAPNSNPATVEQNVQLLQDLQANSPSDYYDTIGREPDFIYGWSDYATSGSNLRDSFDKRRDDANRMLKRANGLLSIAVVNHVVSAFDAFRTARHKIERLVPFGFHSQVNFNPFAGRYAVQFSRELP